MENWNGNSFSVYCDELSILEIVQKHHMDLDKKTDKLGDHAGSWQGLSKPTLSEEGAHAQVEKNMSDIVLINENIEKLKQPTKHIIKTFEQLKTLTFNQGDVIEIENNLVATETIIIDVDITINGNNKLIECGVDGLNKIFMLKGSKVVVKNINFDMKLRGRGCIEFYYNKLIDITNCFFSGYSLEHGWSANDSAILVSGVQGGKIENNLFYEFGNQYNNVAENLNRCVTLNGSENIRVINNVFNKVSQCIVAVDFNSLVIESNSFIEFTDNGIYIPSGCLGAKITNNSFKNSTDECIVISGQNVRIVDNDFFECFTAVAFNGPFRNSIIKGNKQSRTTGPTTFVRVRPVASIGTLENVKIIDNILDGELDYHIIGLRDTKNVTLKDNIFKVRNVGTSKFLITTDGQPINIIIKDNVFESVGDVCDVLYNVNTSTPSGLFSYNTLVNTIFKWIGGNVRVEGHRIDSLLKLYEDYTSIFTCSVSPEGQIKAVKGSMITDLQTGDKYTKTTDTSLNTGWVKL